MRVIDWRDSMTILPDRIRSALRLQQRPRPFLGLDISGDRIRLIEMARVAGQLEVTCAATAAIDTAALASVLSTLLSTCGARARHVATSVPGADVFSKRVVVNVPPGGDFEAAIHREAALCIPEDLANVNLDYQVLGTSAGGRRIEVLLVAARKEIVAARASLLREAGLIPVVVDIDSFALGNVFEANHDVPADGTVVLVHIGDQRVTMNVIQAGRSSLAVDVAISPLPDDPRGDDTSWVDNLVDEVHHAISFYWPLNDDTATTTVYLSGMAASLPALQQGLAERLRTRVAPIETFARLRLSPAIDGETLRAQAPLFALAVGLALRGFGES